MNIASLGDFVLASPEGEAPLALTQEFVCRAGDHLVEGQLLRPMTADAITQGLRAIGWDDICLDTSLKFYEDMCTEHLACRRDSARGAHCAKAAWKARPLTLRFVGRIAAGKRLRLRALPGFLEWSYARKMTLDAFAEDMRLTTYPFDLFRGQLSEVRFLARVKEERKIADVQAALEAMGFRVYKLSQIRRDMRLPGLPGADFALWIGLLRWEGCRAVICAVDPFIFEDLLPIAEPGGAVDV